MTDSFTPYSKNRWLERGLLVLLWCWLSLVGTQAHADNEAASVRVERSGDDVWLAAQLQFDLPTAVEEALQKGVPMFFSLEAEILRDRWYWTDKTINLAQRQLRLAYQPLTRRWRFTVYTGSAAVAGSGTGLPFRQYFDTLGQALVALKRVTRWQIGDVRGLDPSAKHRVELRFRLDASQLPLPFQIGSLGQSDWVVSQTLSAPLPMR